MLGHTMPMKDWAIDYVLHVLETKDWTMNRLATETGVAASTINRPLRDKSWKGKLSRDTISKIQAASGINPREFITDGFAEDHPRFASSGSVTVSGSALSALDEPHSLTTQKINEIKIAIDGSNAQIVATINREGIATLRRKLDLLEEMLDH